jgi:predicted nucleic acid-binding protein
MVARPSWLYGTRLREDSRSVMAAVRTFLMRVLVHPWDEATAEAPARIRASAKRLGRSAGAFGPAIPPAAIMAPLGLE